MNKNKVKQIFAGMLNSGSISASIIPFNSELSMSLALRQDLYRKGGQYATFQNGFYGRLADSASSATNYSFTNLSPLAGELSSITLDAMVPVSSGETTGLTMSRYHYFLGEPAVDDSFTVTASMPHIIYSWEGPQAAYAPGWYTQNSGRNLRSVLTFTGSVTGSYTGSLVYVSIKGLLPSSSAGADAITFYSGSGLNTTIVSGSFSMSFSQSIASAVYALTRSALQNGISIEYYRNGTHFDFFSGSTPYGFVIGIYGTGQT